MSSCDSFRRSGERRTSFRAITRRVRSFLKDKSGVAAVDVALMLPLFIVIIFATIEFGRGLKAWNDMNHALGKAVRVVYLHPDETPTQIEALVKAYLLKYGVGAVAVTATSTTISGTPHMKIEVDFPFTLLIPFSSISNITLSVDTLAPVMSPLK
jgi:Flp pilus assembly protein TadG